MGDTGRAFAVGDAGPMLNPSGMSLVKNFQVLEGSYGYSSRLYAHTLHASMVDNTSGFGIAGGLYYNYHWPSPAAALSGHGHEAGLALSVPIAEPRHARRHGQVLQPVGDRRARPAAPAA